jgi:tRNA pseudouridine32 synthase/23S rRNA pseudouridine746 synthase
VSDGPDAADDDATAPLRPPCVIHEDDDVLVIDKPAGMSFHNDDLVTNLPGVVSTVRALQASGTLRGTDYAGAVHSVHRLDKTTSGILLLAKNERVASWLTAQFAARRVHKYYVALSAKRPSKKMGTVRGDMAKSRRGAWKLTRPEKGKSPAAVTKFASRGVRGASPDGEGEEGRSLRMLLMRPLTGKTHQLRVCAKSLGAPVLGDEKYSGKRAPTRTGGTCTPPRFASPCRAGT